MGKKEYEQEKTQIKKCKQPVIHSSNQQAIVTHS